MPTMALFGMPDSPGAAKSNHPEGCLCKCGKKFCLEITVMIPYIVLFEKIS